MKALRVNDSWIVLPFEVRKGVVEYFTTQVSVPREERPRLDGVPFDTLSGGREIFVGCSFLLERN